MQDVLLIVGHIVLQNFRMKFRVDFEGCFSRLRNRNVSAESLWRPKRCY